MLDPILSWVYSVAITSSTTVLSLNILAFRHATMATLPLPIPLRNGNGVLLKHAPLSCAMNNSIVFGYNKEELEIDQTNLSPFVFDVENNLLKSQNPNGILTQPNTLNKDVKFVDTDRGNYQIDSTSAAYKKAATFGSPVVTDILGNTRKSQPDLGCYEKLP
jgi:hypothetical protein